MAENGTIRPQTDHDRLNQLEWRLKLLEREVALMGPKVERLDKLWFIMRTLLGVLVGIGGLLMWVSDILKGWLI